MSFYSVPRNNTTPEKLDFNPMGLCEKICIETYKVFDAGQLNINLCNKTIILSEFDKVPEGNLTLCGSSVISSCTTDVSTTNVEGKKQYHRATGNILIALKCITKDSNNTTCIGYASIMVPFDQIFFMPDGGINPTEIHVDCNLLVNSSTFITENAFSCNICIKALLKVESKVLVSIPSYGYAKIPMGVDFNDNSCEKFFAKSEFPN